MKKAFDWRHKKRKYVFAAALMEALVLLLCHCQKNTAENLSAEEIRQQASEYLAGRYRAEFTIISTERKADGSGPLPELHSTYHWVLTVTSDQFPKDTFTIRYLHDDNNNWNWLDNYFSLLLRDQSVNYFSEMIQPYLNTSYIIKILWGTTAWPAETGEETSINEWLKAGGKISQIQIFLEDVIPTDELCKASAVNLLQAEPNVQGITFFGLSEHGFSAVLNGADPIDIYQEEFHQDMSNRKRIYYTQWELEKEG